MPEELEPPLTRGETQMLYRKRAGMTQVAAAEVYDISVSQYGQWERDQLALPITLQPIDDLQDHERCLIYRRRAGYTQLRVARELGCCRYWVNKMETGQARCDALLWFWES